MNRNYLPALLSLAITLGHPCAEAACVATPSAEVPLTSTPHGWTVPLAVNGRAVPFLLDTGSERSMMFEDAARSLGIRRDEWVATTTQGIGGEVSLRNADPDTLALAGLPLRRHTMAADNTLVVAPMPAIGAAGLLGQDLLSPYDVAIDGPAATLTLYAVRSCDAKSLPWAAKATTIAAFRATGSVLLIPIEIDGHPLRAEIDSGSTASLVTASGMAKLRLTEAQLSPDQTGSSIGIGPHRLATRRHVFASMTVAGETGANVALWVAPAHILRAIDVLLGLDWISQRRVWLSFSTNTVFVTGANNPAGADHK